MKNSPITPEELDVKVRKKFLKLSKKLEEEKNPQKASLGSSLASFEELPVGVEFLSSKFKMLITYLLILHYYPLDYGVYCYLYIDLEDLLGETSAYWLSVLLDRDLFLKYLIVQETMTEQQFFSGICNEKSLEEALKTIVFRFEEKLRKPKRLIRRKGYRDKGSLGSVSNSVLKKEMRNDFYLTLAQFQMEEQEVLKSDHCILLKEYLAENRVLTDELLVEFKIKKGKGNENTNRKSPEEDYIKRRANEENLRKDREARKTKERLRIQSYERKIATYHLGKEDE